MTKKLIQKDFFTYLNFLNVHFKRALSVYNMKAEGLTVYRILN